MDHHLAAGTAAGVLTALILHPIDLVKVRLQVQDGRTRAENYRGIRDAVSRIWRSEGARGFYRGVGPACWGSGASWGLYFFFYESCKRRLQRGNAAAAAGGRCSRAART
jgi:solute carrier family 25 folate transporter 32